MTRTVLVLSGEAKAAAQESICAQIAEGTPLREICRQEGMPSWRTVYDWIKADPEFAEEMEAARVLGYHAIAEDTLDIADDASNDWMVRHDKDGDERWVLNGEHVQRSKLRIETRLKLLAKWHPSVYGEKITQELTGKNGGPIQITDMTDDELARIAAGSGD
ncbi:Bbp26 [Cupriavidus oxalaticus]|uniref:terminase small subunit-like protein n=1 Tax=Cupriavidus oxalaticus TaxID=96344 RepID=UPI003F740156